MAMVILFASVERFSVSRKQIFLNVGQRQLILKKKNNISFTIFNRIILNAKVVPKVVFERYFLKKSIKPVTI